MNAIVFSEPGPPDGLRLSEVDDPPGGPGPVVYGEGLAGSAA